MHTIAISLTINFAYLKFRRFISLYALEYLCDFSKFENKYLSFICIEILYVILVRLKINFLFKIYLLYINTN